MALAALAALLFSPAEAVSEEARDWTASQRAVIGNLSLSGLPPVTADWRNPLAGNGAAVALGAALFTELRLSDGGKRACATCHDPVRAFTDGLATAAGRVRLSRNTPALAGSAYQRWQGWAGRHASAVSQSIAPLESPRELGGTRTGLARLIGQDVQLRARYEAVAGPVALPPSKSGWPARATPHGSRREQRAWRRLTPAARTAIEEVMKVAAESLAAYVASLAPQRSRFDDYADSLSGDREVLPALAPNERRGLALFIGARAGCVQCHVGPLLSDGQFHNVGTGTSDRGRRAALDALSEDCQSSKLPARDCAELRDAGAAEVPSLLDGAFRTPSLRAVSRTAPYMHDGRHATLEAVLDHYRQPPDRSVHRHELPASLPLSDKDVTDLIAFLRVL